MEFIPDPNYIAKIKGAMLSEVDNGDQIGEDANHDGVYKGKSLELGEGGRSQMLLDKITIGLVEDGMSYDDAQAIAKKRVWLAGVNKYGAAQMNAWAHSK